MRTFYRVETINMDEGGVPVGGYIAACNIMLAEDLGIEPCFDAQELADALSKSDNPKAKEMLADMFYLCDIPVPEIYKENPKDHICLYTEEGYDEASGVLYKIWYKLTNTMFAYSLRVKKFSISDKEILYEDPYQIVISRETYEKRKDKYKFKYIKPGEGWQ